MNLDYLPKWTSQDFSDRLLVLQGYVASGVEERHPVLSLMKRTLLVPRWVQMAIDVSSL